MIEIPDAAKQPLLVTRMTYLIVSPGLGIGGTSSPPWAAPIRTDAVASPASLFTNTSLLRFESSGVGPGVENSVGHPLGVEQPRVVEGPVMISTIGSIGIAAPGAVTLNDGVLEAF